MEAPPAPATAAPVSTDDDHDDFSFTGELDVEEERCEKRGLALSWRKTDEAYLSSMIERFPSGGADLTCRTHARSSEHCEPKRFTSLLRRFWRVVLQLRSKEEPNSNHSFCSDETRADPGLVT
jgi:hypothetical protein